jgi:hypothetical protein
MSVRIFHNLQRGGLNEVRVIFILDSKGWRKNG